MDRMCAVPCGDGAYWTKQRVAGGGILYLRRCSVVRRFTLTSSCRPCVMIPSSRLVIDTISNPNVYCSCASSSVRISGPHWTKNSSTHVKRRLCWTFLGSARAKTLRTDAFHPGASLPRRGSMVVVGFRLAAWSRLYPFFLFVLKCRTIRVPPASVGWEVGGGMFPKASVMVGCRDVVLTSRGEGLSGRFLHSGAKMSL